MNWGAIPTRFEGWSRGAALALVAVVAALLVAVAWSPEAGPAPKLRASKAQPSDLQLYRDIIDGVRSGGDYYKVAAEAQRKNHYPLKPFFTFRLPTHATVYAMFGHRVMMVALWLLCGGLMVAWWMRLRSVLPLPLLGAIMILIGTGLGGMLQPQAGLFHESWAALLLALMVAIRRPENPWPAIVAGGLALMIRELALPMILAMGGLALLERRWREAAGWALAVVLFGIYMTLHAQWVSEVVLPGDPPSPGWSRVLGAEFAFKSIAKVTYGIRLPDAIAAGLLLLSLFGWASVKTGWALRVSILLAGYTAMLALFARPDTFYWGLLPAPLAYAGLAFLPKATSDLAKAVTRTPYRAA
ncbi:hypothetical protein LZ496_03405 [Sphingomonas sp. NSE70-1]|uniref:Dolichyl-phosphate-mannose-protein mannosyltransferase n=1 Tax=Sphingomonas caseinilyticus TaxID=2908205 RepID=A0ABT0RSK8_9SPHN|nr:hypothetical protein [Sphingomonas caseinilyticus]MCL6697831.1 hypothetical protein [Sphingomonas caseinilyticus]